MAVFEEPEINSYKKKFALEHKKERIRFILKKGAGSYLYHLLYPSKRLLEDGGKLIIIGYPN